MLTFPLYLNNGLLDTMVESEAKTQLMNILKQCLYSPQQWVGALMLMGVMKE